MTDEQAILAMDETLAEWKYAADCDIEDSYSVAQFKALSRVLDLARQAQWRPIGEIGEVHAHKEILLLWKAPKGVRIHAVGIYLDGITNKPKEDFQLTSDGMVYPSSSFTHYRLIQEPSHD